MGCEGMRMAAAEWRRGTDSDGLTGDGVVGFRGGRSDAYC